MIRTAQALFLASPPRSAQMSDIGHTNRTETCNDRAADADLYKLPFFGKAADDYHRRQSCQSVVIWLFSTCAVDEESPIRTLKQHGRQVWRRCFDVIIGQSPINAISVASATFILDSM